MKYLLLGDLHGATREDFERLPRAEVFDGVVCLGDFDLPETVLGFLDYCSSFDSSRVFVVPGNHDYCILRGNLPIQSPDLNRMGVSYLDLVRRMGENTPARNYLESLIDETLGDGFSRNLDFQGIPVKVVHGGFYGELNFGEFSQFQNGDRNLWYRCNFSYPECFVFGNFSYLKEVSSQVLIRGHDHNPFFVEEGEILPLFHFYSSSLLKGNFFSIESGRRYIVDPGAFSAGNYGVLEKEEGDVRVSFRKV